MHKLRGLKKRFNFAPVLAIPCNVEREAGAFDGIKRLRNEPVVADEIWQVMQLGVEASRLSPGGLGEGLSDILLNSHAHYTRPEILAAFGLADEERSARGRQQESERHDDG